MHVPATLTTKCYQLSIDSLSTSSHCTCLALESDQFYSKNTCCNWENKLSSIQNDIAELKTSKIGNFQFSCSSRPIHLASLTSKSVDFLTHSATECEHIRMQDPFQLHHSATDVLFLLNKWLPIASSMDLSLSHLASPLIWNQDWLADP